MSGYMNFAYGLFAFGGVFSTFAPSAAAGCFVASGLALLANAVAHLPDEYFELTAKRDSSGAAKLCQSDQPVESA